MPTRITSMKQLKSESEQGAEFFIFLNHGLRSSKDIVWDAEARKFHIFNHLDQTEQHLTKRQLITEGLTNIGYAKRECRDRMRRCMKHEEEKRVKITPLAEREKDAFAHSSLRIFQVKWSREEIRFIRLMSTLDGASDRV